LLKQILEPEHDVLIANNGEQAVETALTFEPSLIISDWKLEGGIDGVEACRQIMAQKKTTIVFLSGSPIQQLMELSDALSPLGVLSKPVNLKTLSSLIQTLNSNSTQQLKS
jgi:CheY-like chemotaxis protein